MGLKAKGELRYGFEEDNRRAVNSAQGRDAKPFSLSDLVTPAPERKYWQDNYADRWEPTAKYTKDAKGVTNAFSANRKDRKAETKPFTKRLRRKV